MAQAQDFHLVVNGEKGNYTVEARGPGGISIPPLPFEWSDTPPQGIAALQQGDAPTRQEMQAIGSALFEALLPRKIVRALSRSYDELHPETHLRLKLSIRPPELNILPWELIYDPDEELFMAARLSSPVVRFIESGVPGASLLARQPLKILYVQSAPTDLPPLDLTASETALRAQLGAKAEITPLLNATPAALRSALRQPYHILHYDGHAAFDPETQTGCICLQDENGATALLSGEMLATLLDGSSIRLVILAACQSGMDSGRKRFVGIAHHLMKTSNLPAVIAMQYSIPDAAAIAFTGGFYGALADEYPVDAAVTEGRKAILTNSGGEAFSDPSWATPVLFLRSEDSDILKSSLPVAQGQEGAGSPKLQTNINIGNISGISGGQINIAGGNVINQSTGSPKPR